MHRIDDPTAVAALPAPRPPGTPGYFTGGSPGTGGFLATRVRYEFMNAVQEELSAIAEAAGLTLDKTNNNQVLAALRQMLRFKLTQDEYLYIDPAGDDANDGLTPETPFRTGQAAWSQALTVDLNNHNLILQFANGTYTDPITCVGRAARNWRVRDRYLRQRRAAELGHVRTDRQCVLHFRCRWRGMSLCRA